MADLVGPVVTSCSVIVEPLGIGPIVKGDGSVKILAVWGSLRCGSSNETVLRAVAELAPAGVEVVLYGDGENGIGKLPLFNPDLEAAGKEAQGSVVAHWRAALAGADGVVISSPEYAHGVTGVLKNALDWLVGSGELVGKPVALINASSRATVAQASLVEILMTMDARVVVDVAGTLDVPLAGKGLDVAGILKHPQARELLAEALAGLIEETGESR